ncbi:MAG: tetratricopeptide repeat protein [Deltaproteobacteria bacterium]|nr:tetratricopeptide repeat protein [Deltaproteobacteria bacterium]
MIRRFWSIALFFVLASLVIIGTMEIFTQAHTNVAMVRLPNLPQVGEKRLTLQRQLQERRQEVRYALSRSGTGRTFGQAVGELGRLYQANHFYERALGCYRLAREYDPTSPLWFYLSASIHQQRGETEAVLGFLKRTLRLSEDYSPAVLKLADSYFKADHIIQARKYYHRRLELQPGDPYALMGLARIAMDKGRWDAAETHLKQGILSDPEFGDAHRLMAEVHQHHNRPVEMKKSLDRAGKCPRFHPAPDPWVDRLQDLCYDPEQLLVLGSMALSQMDLKSAIQKHFARALTLAPNDPATHLAMGKAWFMAGDWSRARDYLVQSIELDPKSDQAYFHLGLIARRSGSLEKAEQLFLRALEFQANNPNVHNNLGVTYLEQGAYPSAIQAFRRALEIYPEHLEALYNLGMAQWASGDTRAAVEQYERVLNIKPNWKVPANSLAWILATDKDPGIRDGETALKWAKVACEGEGAKNPDYLDTLAAAYAEAGKFDMAVKTVNECLELALMVGDKPSISELKTRLRAYQDGKGYVE